ncbi:MAG: ribokinase [Chloroflexota bacterium]
MSAKIAVVGSLNMDLVVLTPRIPAPGETIIGGEFNVIPGGKGANQAIAAARLGGDVSMVGRVGEDDFGAALIQNLETAKIEHQHVRRHTEAATGVALIEVDDEAQNSIVVAPGANLVLSRADVEQAEATIAQADILLLQLESPLEAITRAAEIAHANQTTVILNPAPAQPVPANLLTLVDILVPNESETALLTDLPVDTEEEIRAAGQKLQALGVGAVILTLGERGAFLVSPEKTQLYPTFSVTPIDTTAAGDCFLGGLAVALGEGKSLADAIQWGNAAGALATTKLGAQPSAPTRDSLQALLAEQGS